MRIKVQLLFLVVAFALLVGAAPAGAAEYGVLTCNGQSAATGGWTLFASGPNTALSENCAASGGSMAAVLAGNQAPAASNAGWQVYAWVVIALPTALVIAIAARTALDVVRSHQSNLAVPQSYA